MRLAPRVLVPRTTGRARTASLVTAAGIMLATAAPATASAALVRIGAPPADPGARVRGIPEATTQLPATTASAARAARHRSAHWLVGIGGDHRRAATLVRRAGGTFDTTLGFASVPTSRADRLARRLGTQVRWAGPDVRATRLSSFELPDGATSPWSRSVGDMPGLAAPDGTLATVGLVDDAISPQVAELQGVTRLNRATTDNPHGTMVDSVATAPYNGVGVVGVADHAPVLAWGTNFYCGDVAAGIVGLVRHGAKVINLSLGFPDSCFTLWNAISYAYAHGVSVVAASGNDGDTVNQLTYPASYPHVITAGAVDQSLVAAKFSNFSDYVDVAAPGVNVPVDVPKKFDGHAKYTGDDTVVDGLSQVSGTSFAAPYVTGALSWVLGARPDLDPGQAEAVLRESSLDLGPAGFDQHTGYGLVQVAAAMAAPAPAPDLLEPNDDPAFTRAQTKGTFGKPTVWAGGDPVTLNASGDSADDPVDAYRIKVPGGARVTVSLQASAGLTDLYAFDQSVISFGGKPVDHSTRPGLEPDVIRLHNSGTTSRVAFVVVNTVDSGTRLQSQYALAISRS